MAATEVRKHPEAQLVPVDSSMTMRISSVTSVEGLPVLGPLAALVEVVEAHAVDEVLIAIPTAGARSCACSSPCAPARA